MAFSVKFTTHLTVELSIYAARFLDDLYFTLRQSVQIVHQPVNLPIRRVESGVGISPKRTQTILFGMRASRTSNTVLDDPHCFFFYFQLFRDDVLYFACDFSDFPFVIIDW